MGIRNWLYKMIRPVFEEYDSKLDTERSNREKLEENVRNLNAELEGYSGLVENVRNLNAQLEGYSGLVENVRNLNAQLEGYSQVLTNVRNNNDALNFLENTVDMQKVKISILEKKVSQDGNAETLSNDVQNQEKADLEQDTKDQYAGIDYFDFENYFRGSRQEIKKRQKVYLPYYQGHKNVIDLGCGRGEFLELLKENDIDAYGVDMYEEFVELCTIQGLRVEKEDAVSAVEHAERLGGIFAGQLIEHLNLRQIVHLCELAYNKLDEDAYFIIETPNPTSLAIYTHAFYMDPSHQKPVHPLTMKYILEKAGFQNIEILYTESSKLPVEIPELKGDNLENLTEFNEAMQEVQRALFGSQDYAIIAKK